MNMATLQDQKAQIRSEFNNKLRDQRRQLDRDFDKAKQKIQDKIN